MHVVQVGFACNYSARLNNLANDCVQKVSDEENKFYNDDFRTTMVSTKEEFIKAMFCSADVIFLNKNGLKPQLNLAVSFKCNYENPILCPNVSASEALFSIKKSSLPIVTAMGNVNGWLTLKAFSAKLLGLTVDSCARLPA